MTRKDFKLLATELKEIRPVVDDENDLEYRFWRQAVGAVGVASRLSNDRFNWLIFKEAAGMDEEVSNDR